MLIFTTKITHQLSIYPISTINSIHFVKQWDLEKKLVKTAHDRLAPDFWIKHHKELDKKRSKKDTHDKIDPIHVKNLEIKLKHGICC